MMGKLHGAANKDALIEKEGYTKGTDPEFRDTHFSPDP